MALFGTSVEHAASGGKTVSVTLPNLGKASKLVVYLIVFVLIVAVVVTAVTTVKRNKDIYESDARELANLYTDGRLSVVHIEQVTTTEAREFVSSDSFTGDSAAALEILDALSTKYYTQRDLRHYVIWFGEDGGELHKTVRSMYRDDDGTRVPF